MEQFPGNSHNEQAPKEKKEPKKVERVVKGQVVRQKQPLSKRLKAHFMPETDLSLSEHVIFEVLLPGATAAASEVFHQTIDIILPVQSRRGVPRRHRGGGGTYVEYGSTSRRRGVPWDREDRDPVVSRRARATHAFDQVIIHDRVEAQEVLDEMWNLLSQYDAVTVGDFYDCVGESKEFTDENYGWTDLNGTRIVRRGGGYIIDLPPTEQLKRIR